MNSNFCAALLRQIVLLASLMACAATVLAQPAAPAAPGPIVEEGSVVLIRAPWSPFSYCAAPEYPKVSLRLSEEGTVTIKFLVAEGGGVLDAEIVKSSGFVRLDQATLMAIKRCTFTPQVMYGVPIKVWMKTDYKFLIN